MANSKIQFFDCNCIAGPMTAIHPEGDLPLHELQSRLRELDIERLLVTHSYALEYDPGVGNLAASELCCNAGGLLPCYVLLPPATHELPAPGETLLDYLDRGGARAVRLAPKTHGFGLGDVWCRELLDCLSQAGVPVLVEYDETNWAEIDQVLCNHPTLKLVILRAGYRIDRWLYPLLEKHTGLHLEISWYHTFGGIEAIARRFGAERLLFGTGAPIWEPAGPVGLVAYADLSEREKTLIASANLDRLLWRGLNHG